MGWCESGTGRGATDVGWRGEGQRLVSLAWGGGENWVYANEMQMKARKLRVWECHDIAPIWPP